MTFSERLLVPYDRYRVDARDGDVLLWMPRDAMGEVIARETNGPYCHASAVVYLHEPGAAKRGQPFESAYAERMNGFLSPLCAAVRRHSGCIDLFRIPELRPEPMQGIRDHLLGDLGGDYEWANIGMFAAEATWLGRWLEQLPFLRSRLMAKREALSRSRTSAICSQHVARAYGRGARIELCPGRSYARTSPNDLARSARLKYHGTLVWPPNWRN